MEHGTSNITKLAEPSDSWSAARSDDIITECRAANAWVGLLAPHLNTNFQVVNSRVPRNMNFGLTLTL